MPVPLDLTTKFTELKNKVLNSVNNEAEAKVAADVIKLAKRVIILAKDAKKDEQTPIEITRKNAEVIVDKAKADLKVIANTYATYSKYAEEIDASHRGYVTAYLYAEERKKQIILEEIRKKEEEAARIQAEAQSDRVSQDPITAQMVDFLEEKAFEAELKAVEQAVPVKSAISFREDIEVEVVDINLVHSKWFLERLDTTKLKSSIEAAFPGICVSEQGLSFKDSKLVNPEFIIESLDLQTIKLKFKEDPNLVIQGLGRKITKIPIIR